MNTNQYQIFQEAPILNEYLDIYESLDNDHYYFFDGHPVPRTSDILSAMLHNQNLMVWSNRLGRYQHQDYNEYLEKAASIGTFVHSCIEKYIKDGVQPQSGEIPFMIDDYVMNAFTAFLNWWEQLTRLHKVRVLYSEKSMTCRFFGGTLDLLLEIDDKYIVLVDFKSSNYPTFKFFLQLASYRYMLREEGINVDKCLVLMLNKYKPLFMEMILDFSNPEHFQYITECEKTFLTLAQGYLQRTYLEEKYRQLFPSRFIGSKGEPHV